MPEITLKGGVTSQSIPIMVQDSSSTIGAGLSGLVFNTASLTAYYWRPGGSPTSITLATLAAITTAYSSGGFKEADATNLKGVYRLDLPDAAIAAGVPWVVVVLYGASNMVPVRLLIFLTAIDQQDTVRGGMTALPNVAAGAVGGLVPMAVATGTASAGAASTITLAGASATDNIYNEDSVFIASGTGAGQVRAITGYVGSTKVATVSPAWTTTPDNTSVFYVIANAPLLTRVMTEGYAADGASATLQQALYEIMQYLEERAASGSTLTVHKRDGTTVAMTFTMDDPTNPTTQTRSS